MYLHGGLDIPLMSSKQTLMATTTYHSEIQGFTLYLCCLNANRLYKSNITLVQRQFNEKILAIRSDNGSKFKNYTVEEFLSDEGIKHQYSVAYTPQQNGVAERKNQTLMDATRTMIAEFKSLFNFWTEAISTACHATNRLYLRKLKNMTPYEILNGKKPDLSYFRVFSCNCFILKKGNRLSKFKTRSIEGIFVGYAANSHTYRVYNKSTE